MIFIVVLLLSQFVAITTDYKNLKKEGPDFWTTQQSQAEGKNENPGFQYLLSSLYFLTSTLQVLVNRAQNQNV